MNSQGPIQSATLDRSAEATDFSRHPVAGFHNHPAREPSNLRHLKGVTQPHLAQAPIGKDHMKMCQSLSSSVDAIPISGGPVSVGAQYEYAPANQIDEGHGRCVTHSSIADIDTIRELWRDRQALVRANTALTLQIKSLCRRICGADKSEADKLFKAIDGKGSHPMADHTAVRCVPFFGARDQIEIARKQTEKKLAKLASGLPAIAFVAQTRGFGIASFAAIVGECGDLSNYSNPAKVWKRMGLAVIDGKAQRRVTGIDAVAHGFSPARRAVSWNIGASIIKVGGEYRKIYDERKAYEVDRDPSIKKIAAHARAQRYMEKRVLRDLWRFWRDVPRGNSNARD